MSEARGFTPGDLEEDVEDVEARALGLVRSQALGIESSEGIRWLVVGLAGRAPDTEIVMLFTPRDLPKQRYGLRFALWPLSQRDPVSAFAYFDISLMEFLADGIGAEARLGRLAVPEGAILWLPLDR